VGRNSVRSTAVSRGFIAASIFPCSGIVTKIAAIEQRSVFQIKGEHRDYIGIELGGGRIDRNQPR